MNQLGGSPVRISRVKVSKQGRVSFSAKIGWSSV